MHLTETYIENQRELINGSSFPYSVTQKQQATTIIDESEQNTPDDLNNILSHGSDYDASGKHSITLRHGTDYDADTESDGDDIPPLYEDLETILICDECGLDFWNIWFNNNIQEHLKRIEVIKIKRMKKRSKRNIIKINLESSNMEETHLEKTQDCEKRKSSAFKFMSFHILEKFESRSEKKYTLEYDTGRTLKKVIIGRGHKNEYPEANSVRLYNDKSLSERSKWRGKCLKMLKSNNDKIRTAYSALPGVHTCLFCFEEKSNEFCKNFQKYTNVCSKKHK